MIYRSILVAASLCVCAFFVSRAQQSDQAKSKQFIVESEKHWAEADAAGDATFVDGLLADDFLGVAPEGTFYSKAEALQQTRQNKGRFVSNQVNDVKVRFYGDTAVAQGTETWEMVSAKRGSYVWTDTWVKRNSNWQIVAAEDVTTSQAPTLPQ
jgi:hypothetical protein